MKAVKVLTCCAALALVSGVAYAHGVGAKVSPQAPFAFEFYYSTGEKMSYTPTMVYAPGDDKIPWQEGNTDDEGRFAFVPTKDGEWTVICDGPAGHRAKTSVNINLKELNEGGQENKAVEVHGSSFPQGWDLFVKALLGVSLLFNISALACFCKNRKKKA